MAELYKYRAFDKYAIDILVYRRLHMSSWEILNDPHEAQMLVKINDGLNFHMNPTKLKKWVEMEDIPEARICSLSRTCSSNLLWSHYAQEQKGIAIGFNLPRNMKGVFINDIIYDDKVPKVTSPVSREDVINALSHKSREWEYEQETRLISFNKDILFFEDIELTEVLLGLRCEKSDMNLIKRLIDDESIKIGKMGKKPGTYQFTISYY